MCQVHVCLAVTCHLHFLQNDQDLLHATAVTLWWNGYWNKSITESWPRKIKFSCHSSQDSNLWSWIRSANHWTIPLPQEFLQPVCTALTFRPDNTWAGDVWCPSPVWNVRAVIWFPLSYLLSCSSTWSCCSFCFIIYFFLLMVHSFDFSQKIHHYFWLRDSFFLLWLLLSS